MDKNRPLVIKKSDPAKLEIEWEDGHRTAYTTAELRRLCPCARCIDETTGVRVLNPESVPFFLTHTDVRMVGNYAITVAFADGHNTGIFPFPYLRQHDPQGSGA